jgi:electron transfer flavoprotein beta subunit
MNIVVLLKPVLDNTRTRLSEAGPEGDTWMMNPLDEYALETALRLKEAVPGSTLHALSAGEAGKELLKKALACGADAVTLVASGGSVVASLAAQVKALEPHVLLYGQKGLDTGAGLVGPTVAAHLGLNSLGYIKAVTPQEGALTVTRESECGVETHQLPLPVALGVMKGDYELRTPNIKGVMKANKAEIPVVAPVTADAPAAQSLGYALPAAKPVGRIITADDPAQAADAFIQFLKEAHIR